MATLALDLGTKTGYAVGNSRRIIESGTWTLAGAKELRAQKLAGANRSGDCRFFRLMEHIAKTINRHNISRIIFEDVIFFTSTSQTQLWASLRSAIWAIKSANPHIETECVHVGTLKKFATGNGRADKAEMNRAAIGKFPSIALTNADDNQIDALWLLEFDRNRTNKKRRRKI